MKIPIETVEQAMNLWIIFGEETPVDGDDLIYRKLAEDLDWY